MNKRWIKNGVFASDTIELNGCVVCNPTEDMLRQAMKNMLSLHLQKKKNWSRQKLTR